MFRWWMDGWMDGCMAARMGGCMDGDRGREINRCELLEGWEHQLHFIHLDIFRAVHGRHFINPYRINEWVIHKWINRSLTCKYWSSNICTLSIHSLLQLSWTLWVYFISLHVCQGWRRYSISLSILTLKQWFSAHRRYNLSFWSTRQTIMFHLHLLPSIWGQGSGRGDCRMDVTC